MIYVNLSNHKKKENTTVEKLTNKEHQQILMYFIKCIVKGKSDIVISFILSNVYDDIENNQTYFLKVKIISNKNLHAINAFIATILDAFSRFLEKDDIILYKKVKYKREYRKSNQRLKLEKEDFNKIYNFLKENDLNMSENLTYYIKRKFGLERKIYNKENIFSKNLDAIGIYFLCCKLLKLKPLREHVVSENDVLNNVSDFFI